MKDPMSSAISAASVIAPVSMYAAAKLEMGTPLFILSVAIAAILVVILVCIPLYVLVRQTGDGTASNRTLTTTSKRAGRP